MDNEKELLMKCKNFNEAHRIVFGRNYKNGREKQRLIIYCFDHYNIDIENVIRSNKKNVDYCLNCGKKIIEAHSHKRKFCSLSCAASYNNTLRRKNVSETNHTKEAFIEKYGKEKYEELLQSAKKYYNSNKDKILEKKKEYREIHLEEYKIYQKEYQKQYRKTYNETKSGRAKKLANTYKCRDKKRNMDNDITGDFIEKHIFDTPCIYCGETDFRKLGCDRIDNTKGHLVDNVVCACRQCNCEREYFKKSVEEFKKFKKILLLSENLINEIEN